MKYRKVLVGILLLFIVFAVVFVWFQSRIINSGKAEVKMIQGVSEKLSKGQIIHKNQKIQFILNMAQDVFKDINVADRSIYTDNAAHMQWQNQDDWYISDNAAVSVASYYACENNALSRLDSIVPKIYPRLEKIFIDQSFVKKNISSNIPYGNAYEYGEVRCIINGDPECFGFPGEYGERFGSSIKVVCSDNISERAKEQAPLLEALKLEKKPENTINTLRYFGEYIYVGLSYDYLIARKMPDGSYRQIYRGQDSLTCNQVRELGLPADFQDKCTEQ